MFTTVSCSNRDCVEFDKILSTNRFVKITVRRDTSGKVSELPIDLCGLALTAFAATNRVQDGYFAEAFSFGGVTLTSAAQERFFVHCIGTNRFAYGNCLFQIRATNLATEFVRTNISFD